MKKIVLVLIGLILLGATYTGLPIAPTNAVMKEYPSWQYFSVLRLGVNTIGDAPPQWFVPSKTACSIPGGDVGSQVPSINNGCFNASFQSGGVDVREWGVVGDGITDNKVTLQAALTWLGTNGGELVSPAGTFYSSAALSVTPPLSGSIMIVGTGADNTFLKGSATGSINYLTINETKPTQSFHIRDLSCLAGGPSTTAGVCIVAKQSGTVVNPAFTALSDISNVTFRGSDGYGLNNCWADDVNVISVSQINFINDNFYGCTTFAGVGINLVGSSSATGVVYNITGSNFSGLIRGIVNGAYVQGVTVSQSNFAGDTEGVFVPTAITGLAQLTVTSSQCGDTVYCLYDAVGIPGLIFSNNLVYDNNANDVGINEAQNCDGCIISNNAFEGLSLSGTIGVEIAAGFGTVIGNTFLNEQVAIDLASASSTIVVRGNSFSGITTQIISASNGNSISGVNGTSITSVSGAVSGTGGLVELTVASTSAFVNGQNVFVGGVGGVNGAATGVLTPITIIDMTHMILNAVLFGGAYTSGGYVSSAQ